MNRRQLLVGAGTLAGSLLAGCLGDEESSGAGTPTDTEPETTASNTTTTPTTTGTATSTTATGTEGPSNRSVTTTRLATESPGSTTADRTRTTRSPPRSSTASRSAVVDRSIEVRDRACGNPVSEGTVAFAERRVVVTGTITGSDSCATAALDEVTYDASADRLRVVVATERERGEGTTCAQCLTEIDYEATVEFATEGPETVVLVHRGTAGETRVTTATA